MKPFLSMLIALTAMVTLSSRAFADEPVNMKYCVDYIKSNKELATFYPLTAEGKVDPAARATLTGRGGVREWKDGVDQITGDETTNIKALVGLNPSHSHDIQVNSKNGVPSSIAMSSTTTITSAQNVNPFGSGGTPGMPAYGGMGVGSPTYTSNIKTSITFEVINNTCIPKLEIVGPSLATMAPVMMPFQPGFGPFTLNTHECRRFKVAFDRGLNAENIASSSLNTYVPEYQDGGKKKFTPADRLELAKFNLNRCMQRSGVSDAISDESIWKNVKLDGWSEAPDAGR